MGSLVVSLDAELGWGFHHERPLPGERIRAGRAAWIELLDLFDEYAVPATWAVVGHLLLDDCDGGHAGHPAGPDPCTDGSGGVGRKAAWFDDGLVDRVLDAAVGHELASHGFTHVHFAHERMDRSMAETEVGAAAEAFADRGHAPRSFVFPVNEVGYRDVLADHGFACYRGATPARPGPLAKVGNAFFGRHTPPIVTPSVDEYGMVNVPASLYLFGFEGALRRAVEFVRDDPVVSAVRRGLEALRGTDGVLHLWLHPHNVTGERDRRRVERVLEAIDDARRRTGVDVETMGDVARRVGGDGNVVGRGRA